MQNSTISKISLFITRIIIYISGYIILLVFLAFISQQTSGLSNETVGIIDFETIFLATILAPLLETLIFNVGIFLLLRKAGINYHIVYISISSILFAISHGISYEFVGSLFVSGALMYEFLRDTQRILLSFWKTVLAHSLINGALISLSVLLGEFAGS